jgi:hypothetical protein
MPAKKHQITDEERASQQSKFKEAARELGCDDSEEKFDESLRKLARHKVSEDGAPKARPSKEGR